MTKRIAQFSLLVLLATMPLPAMANGVSDISAASAANEEEQSFSAQRTELSAFDRVTVSAQDGVAAVEQYLTGATVVDISFDGSRAAPVYHVKAYQRGKIWSGSVDAATRNVVLDGSMPIAKLDRDDRSNVADVARAGFNLSEAIMIAEKDGAGKAVSAGLSRTDGKLVFVVVVASDSNLKEVSISPTGENRSRHSPASDSH